MARKFDGGKLVLATHNAGKVLEIRDLLAPFGADLLCASELGLPVPEETGTTFTANAELKALASAEGAGIPALADDSGLEVDALGGQPGIFSARYSSVSGPEADEANNQKLLSELSDVPISERTARFYCAIAYLRFTADPTPLICLGSWEGSILREPAGENGFGYDPLFYVSTHKCSSAELLPEVKNSISHRALAIHKFADKIKKLMYV